MGPNYQGYPNYPQQQVAQMRPTLGPNSGPSQAPYTNKILVMSLQDAYNRPCELNSIMLYVDQTNGHVYEIYTDFMGQKQHREFDTKEIVREDLQKVNAQLQERVMALEAQLASLTKKEESHE